MAKKRSAGRPVPRSGNAVDTEDTIDLLTRARAGDASSLNELVSRALPRLRRWAHGRLPAFARTYSDTQDLVQETLLASLTRVEHIELRHAGALQAYLRQAVQNRIRDEIRRSQRVTRVDLPELLARDESSPLELAIGRETLARYEAALQQLKPGEREILLARLELGLSYEEIATAFNRRSPMAARMMLSRTMVRLASIMDTNDLSTRRGAPSRYSGTSKSDSRVRRYDNTSELPVDDDQTSSILLKAALDAADGVSLEPDASSSSELGDEAKRVIAELGVLVGIAETHRLSGAETGTSDTSPQILIPGQQWAHFVVGDMIGRGGFGTVYRARDPWLQCDYALKVLKVPARIEAASWLHEALTLARVRDPNVVSIHGAAIDQGMVGLWMDLILGETLETRVSRRGPMIERQVIDIGLQLCRALASVHDIGIVHGDLSAKNVIVDPDGRVMLTDFGASRLVGRLTGAAPATPARFGTISYSSPEMLSGGASTVQSDVYALGVLLFHLLTADMPNRVGRASALGESSALSYVIDVALAPDPSKRWPTTRAMEGALTPQYLPPVFEPALRVTSGSLPDFVDRATPGLRGRPWLLDLIETRVMELTATVSLTTGVSEPLERAWDFDLSPFLDRDTNPDHLVFLGLYQSGAVRSISVDVTSDSSGVRATLIDPLAMIDPAARDEGLEEMSCKVQLVGLMYPPYAA
jgi:RNA polymerase sigma factor (sigma-70 family)